LCFVSESKQFYREAVTTQSPGLLQPWDHAAIVINRNAVASGDEVLGERFSHHGAPWDATALRLQNDWFVVNPGLKQPCVLRGKRFAVKTTWIQSTKDKALSTKH